MPEFIAPEFIAPEFVPLQFQFASGASDLVTIPDDSSFYRSSVCLSSVCL